MDVADDQHKKKNTVRHKGYTGTCWFKCFVIYFTMFKIFPSEESTCTFDHNFCTVIIHVNRYDVQVWRNRNKQRETEGGALCCEIERLGYCNHLHINYRLV